MLVAVTRPENDARRSAARLAALGFEPLVAPVLRIEPTGEAIPAAAFDAMAVTSANAVPALAAHGDALLSVPAFAVGERTAVALRAAGFSVVRVGAGDGAALARAILAAVPRPRAVLHPGGAERKAEPGASLEAAGVGVVPWRVYGAKPVEALPDGLRGALAHGSLGAVLHYSGRSAAALADLAGAAGLRGALAPVAHACLSEDAAEPLRALGFSRVLAADRPDESSLFETLQGLVSQGGAGLASP